MRKLMMITLYKLGSTTNPNRPARRQISEWDILTHHKLSPAASASVQLAGLPDGNSTADTIRLTIQQLQRWMSGRDIILTVCSRMN